MRTNPGITPLAAALRPQKLDDIVGQDHLLGEGKALRLMADKKEYQSIIFWGPPGTGKTSIVRSLANETDSHFRQLNATQATVKQLRTIITAAKKALPDKRTFVFVDECHRWNKAQQDALLPSVEDGTIIFFGATTERPKFAVNSTLLSRCLVMEVKPLNKSASLRLILKVIEHYLRKKREVRFKKEAAVVLVDRCGGDGRKIIMALETCIEILSSDDIITQEHIDLAVPTKEIVFDAHGNDHFDLAHCYQEAIQHSDVNGAIYWLAKWIESGEDPAYICRRMLITAFEDCAGNPFAATTAMAACYTTERTGLPECVIPMSLATCEMAMSKRNKSAYYAIKAALKDVRSKATVHVPEALRAGTAHGQSDYVKTIKKIYLKGWQKDWEVSELCKNDPEYNQAIDPTKILYGVGIEHVEGEFGMVDGPTPDLDRLLGNTVDSYRDWPADVDDEESSKLVIVQFHGEDTIVLYRWDNTRELGINWRYVEQ